MPSINFKVSDSQKLDFLFSLLNPNFNEAGGWMIEYGICEVYEEYAIARNYAEGIFERIYFTKNDENDSLEITNKERCYIVDVNEAEKEALKTIQGEGTFEQAVQVATEKDETINSLNATVSELNEQITTLNTNVTTLTEENSQYSTKVEELENNISTLSTERDEARTNYDNAQARVTEVENTNVELTNNLATITAERDSLAAYRKNVEDEAKKAVVNNYTEHLSEEVIEEYLTNLDNYTIEQLDKELTYEQKKANPALFSKQPVAPAGAMLPKEEDGARSINDILARYEKKH